ncbi:hypothetical protein B9Z55_024549 [Caenorhabditis nigoni]|uniref:Uncharacterized protein n=1 Tax=Caenorhabditis nigoni TaxID=1611254 RepID=A0A2G5SUI0_9PELO|nr:hypothetical protein B9Z55_024549 [Caenorhabditis nigoni]
MPVSFKTPPTSTDRTELTAAVAVGKTKVALEDRSVKADNNEDNTPMAMYRDESFESKRRQTNVSSTYHVLSGNGTNYFLYGLGFFPSNCTIRQWSFA